eukprot:2305976-Alexandrium_andersonii.AAC.1
MSSSVKWTCPHRVRYGRGLVHAPPTSSASAPTLWSFAEGGCGGLRIDCMGPASHRESVACAAAWCALAACFGFLQLHVVQMH